MSRALAGADERLAPLPALLIEEAVRGALIEDLGRAGDITTQAVVPAQVRASAVIAARQRGVVAGMDCALAAFRLIDPSIAVEVLLPDGAPVEPGDVAARIEGAARSMLTAERVALNFLCHLSGVATQTRGLVEAVSGHKAKITCTRKTMPGLRALQKHAVKAGGGVSHRYGLDDGILIKDNHILAASGIGPAVERAKRSIGHMVKIEVEVESLAQLDEALEAGVDAVLLDNMSPTLLRDAVLRIAGRAVAEASGRIMRETAPAIAATGVDLISAGWITHSAPALDLGLDFESG